MRCGASCARRLTLKKSLRAAERDRPDVARRRERWNRYQHRVDPGRLVFVDETWAKTSMTRTHGRAPRGQRLVAPVPHARWTTMTFLAACAQGLVAPCVFDGAINGCLFLAWVTRFLVPTLRRRHRRARQSGHPQRRRRAPGHTRSRCAPVVLPPYSPDLNPIELVFAKLKTLLRKADERSARRLAPHRLTAQQFSPAECAHYLKHAAMKS